MIRRNTARDSEPTLEVCEAAFRIASGFREVGRRPLPEEGATLLRLNPP